MATMVRKQVYLEPRQDVQIKQLAQDRGTTEAEIIRKAVDLLLAEVRRQRRAQAAWDEACVLMESRAEYAVSSDQESGRAWTRDDLYMDRLERNG